MAWIIGLQKQSKHKRHVAFGSDRLLGTGLKRVKTHLFTQPSEEPMMLTLLCATKRQY